MKKAIKLAMTEAEILRDFESAKVPCAQVKILAELNATTVEHICEILVAQGVDRRLLPRKREKAPFKLEDGGSASGATVSAEPATIPAEAPAEKEETPKVDNSSASIAAGVRLCVGEMLSLIEEKRRELSEKMVELTDELERVMREKDEVEKLWPALARCAEEVAGNGC